jgi:hypothetical protein
MPDTKEMKNTILFDEPPYFYVEVCHTEKRYNPKYGDGKICKCGHAYYRHFDTYENMCAIGCKYCQCFEFEEKK